MFFLNKTTAMLLKAIIKAREKIHCHLSNEYFVTSQYFMITTVEIL